MTVRIETQTATPVRVGEGKAAIWALFAMGLILLFVGGFAGSDVLHDSAHDTRHSLSFPCH